MNEPPPIPPAGEPAPSPPRPLQPKDVSGGRQAAYMQGFVCLGPQCEDSCCSGWSLAMSKKDHRRLELVVGKKETHLATRRLPAAKRPAEDWAPGYAEFRTHGERHCHYLNSDDLCRLHTKHGPDALTNVCDQYPRYNVQYDELVEQVGSLACPEVARRCLLSDDANTFVPFEPQGASLDRPPVQLSTSKNGHRKHFLIVREQFLTTMTERELSLGDRLAALLGQAEALASVLWRDELPSEAHLVQVLDHISSTERVHKVPQMMAGVQMRGRSTAVLVSFVFGLLGTVGKRTEKLLENVLKHYEVDALALNEAEFERIVDSYEINRSQVLERHGTRVDTYFTNYAGKHLLSLPLFDELSLSTYIKELVLRVAMLRLIFFSHPSILKLAKVQEGADGTSQLDDAAVAIFQAFAREVEHAPGVKNKLHGLLIEASAYSTPDFLTLTRL